jgi:hypothetical protein
MDGSAAMSARPPELRFLGERLAREQDAWLAQTRSAAARQLSDRVEGVAPRGVGRRIERRGPRAWRLAAVAVFPVCLGALLAMAMLRARPLELTVGSEPGAAGRWITAPVERSIPVQFSDGTAVTLAPEGRARVLDVTARGAHFMLESGSARASVKPNRDGNWMFTAGPFTVEVKGTRFELAWSPQDELFRLVLLEGKVAISGCAVGEARMLFAGETLRASCLTNDFQIARSEPDDAVAVASPPPKDAPELAEPAPLASGGSTEGAALASSDPVRPALRASGSSIPTPAPASVGESPSAPGDSWQALARASKFKMAFARASDRGFDAELRRLDIEDLLLLGDVSRLSGHPVPAVRAYEKVRDRAPGTDSAANAAFSLGRVAFDQRDAYAEAARWFETYLNERGDGPLAREALGRRMEAMSRAGDRVGSGVVAERYLRQYPEGPHAPLARALRTGAE